jgi:hypothetical protein
MPAPHASAATSTSEYGADDLPPWEDVHGDIRRFSDPAVRALMDLAECGPRASAPDVL